MSDDIAASLDAGDVCSAAVRADELLGATVDAINAGDVPAELQEPLMARANELVNEVNCPRPETTTPDEPEDDDDAQGKAKGKKDKQKDEDEGDDDPDDPLPTDVVPTAPVPTETGE